MISIEKLSEENIVSFDKITKLNVLNVPQIKHHLHNIIANTNGHILINLAGINFIDSTMFDCLKTLSNITSKLGRRFEFFNVKDELRELFHLVNNENKLKLGEEYKVEEFNTIHA